MAARLPPRVAAAKKAARVSGLSLQQQRERLAAIPKKYRTKREAADFKYLQRITPTAREREALARRVGNAAETRRRNYAVKLDNRFGSLDKNVGKRFSRLPIEKQDEFIAMSNMLHKEWIADGRPAGMGRALDLYLAYHDA